jgi:hypothetical protein
MKKFIGILLMFVLSVGLLSGCGTNYDAQDSTIYILKSGKIVSTDVEEFDTNQYDEEGLKNYIEEAIASYTQENGSKTVELKSLSVEDGTATLTIAYATAGDYMEFNGIELFTGSLAECLAAGYSFNLDFADVTGETIAACDASSFLGGEGYKVAVVKANTNVNVSGKICYVSTENVSLVDEKTIAIKEGTHLLDVTVNAQDTETEPEETESLEADTEIAEAESAADGSVSEDELLVGEEETEVVFEFDEEQTDSSDAGEYSTVYTYIIYK